MTSRSSDEGRRIAGAIADAFLAGEWDPPAMAERAKRALAHRRRWLTELARIVHSGYPAPPRDRPRGAG